MFTTFLTATLLSAAFAIQGALAEFTIHTISLNQCGSAHITWTEAEKPYNLAVVPVDDPCNTILVDLGDHDGLSMTWHNVTLPAGTKVMFSLLDSSDQEAWSGDMTVGDGDSDCLPDAAGNSSASGVSDATGTTLTLTSSFSRAVATPSESATIVGAANAGTLGNASGAMSNVHLPVVSTVLASLAAVVAALAL